MIFAFGGFSNGHLSSVERYDIERDEWLRLSAMHEKRFAFFFRIAFLKVLVNLFRSSSSGVVLKNLIYGLFYCDFTVI